MCFLFCFAFVLFLFLLFCCCCCFCCVQALNKKNISVNNKNKVYKQYLRSRCPSEKNHQQFKTFRNKLLGLIRKSKRMYYFKKFEKVKSDMRQTCKTINNVLGRAQKQSISNQFKRNTETIIMIQLSYQMNSMIFFGKSWTNISI